MKLNNKFFWIYALSATIYFGQGTEGIVNLPFFFYLKEKLSLNESQIMFWGSWISLCWLIKPITGYIVDSSKISKKNWILFSLIGSLIFSIFLGVINFLPLIWLIILMTTISGCASVRDVSIDGIMCCEGKKHNITGKLQSVQWGSITIASLLTGVVGGYIAQHWGYQAGYLILIPIYLIIIAIVTQYKSTESVRKSSIDFLTTLKDLFTDKRLMLVCLFLFLYKFSPGFGTPLSFIIQDKFHWSKQFMGTIDTIGAVFSLIGAGLYFKFSTKINLNKWLFVSTFIGAITTLCYLYFTSVSCIIYTVIFSVIGMFLNLLILDFMAKNTKNGLESVSFALLCSISNLAGTANGFVGAWLFPIVGLNCLIIISALASFLCLPLIKNFKE